MSTRLTDMVISKVSLVDRGASGRRFAILKRDGGAAPYRIRKDVATFDALQASAELRDWLPEALASLGAVIDAALSPEAAAEAGLDTIGRLAAIANAADEFKAALVMRVGAAIQAEAAPVAKRSASKWSGLL